MKTVNKIKEKQDVLIDYMIALYRSHYNSSWSARHCATLEALGKVMLRNNFRKMHGLAKNRKINKRFL